MGQHWNNVFPRYDILVFAIISLMFSVERFSFKWFLDRFLSRPRSTPSNWYDKTIQSNQLKMERGNYFHQLQHSRTVDSNYFVTKISAMSSIIAILPYCYYSTIITNRLQQIADDIYYNSLWYKLPSKFKKYHILSIAAAQRPRFFTGYGIINCSVEICKKVQNSSQKLNCCSAFN